MVLAYDPGNEYTAYCLIGDDRKPVEFGKVPNKDALAYLYNHAGDTRIDAVVIEMVASYGMAVGKSVFETCVMIGRLTEAAEISYFQVKYIYRMEEKVTICHDSKAKDANIRQALIDRFAQHDLKNGKGTKKNPDWFYGFSSDTWSAYAVGTVWLDKNERVGKKL
jgi:hypothetical protein